MAGEAAPRVHGGSPEDLRLYMDHEKIKSAVVDTVRYSKQLAASSPAERSSSRCGS